MVKNTNGGSKHKGLARKLVNAPVNNTLRLPQNDSECFAKVVKMLGNGMCHVNLVYKEQLLLNVVCHIRGKFRNKNKRANLVSTNDILLVGIREWESDIHNCDLLLIYSSHNISLLSLPSFDNLSISSSIHEEVSFSNSNIQSNFISNIQSNITQIDSNDIDFNDI